MKILFVSASVDFSIGDVSRGYKNALERQGHELAYYVMPARIQYHIRATEGKGISHDIISKLASENILNEAMYHHADLVVIISGLNVHPISLWLLGQVDIPVAVILTESPYDDIEQAQWVDMTKVNSPLRALVCTNDKFSAENYGWTYLPPACDPEFHHLSAPDPDFTCDVLMIGTGWPERQQLLEQVNWEGINLKIYGVWPGVRDNKESPLYDSYQPLIVDNSQIAAAYSAAKICLNVHRVSPTAKTPGPRVFELAACGCFQISDSRDELTAIFGQTVPSFVGAEELESTIRYYLLHSHRRDALAREAMQRVKMHTFDQRVKTLMAAVEQKFFQGA